MGWKVLLPQEIKEDARNLLISEGHTLIDGRGFEPEDVKADMLKYQPEAMIVRITPINRDIIECNPNLKVIVRHGAGFDALDVKACHDNGVAALYAPVANSTSVAETAFLLFLELSRDVETHRKIWVEDFYRAKLRIRKNTLNGKTLGIVGCGNIGSRVAKRAMAFEMNVLCYDPYKPAADFPDGVEVVRDLERIFRESDYVSLHAPNTPITRKMVNKETLAMMKKDAFLINTARGALVDEEALYDACKNGIIRGAGIDALAKEPVDPKNPLLTLDNIIMYPHIGGNTEEAAERASYHAAMGVCQVAKGEKPFWPINDIDYETAPTYTDTKKPDKKPVGKYDY